MKTTIHQALRAWFFALAFVLASPMALSQSFTIDTSATSTSPMTGLWNNANESGWGAAVIQQYGVMFVTMYVYDSSGNPIWYVASNCPVTNNGCTGPLYKVTGGSLPTVGWTGQTTVATAGTLTLAFSDVNTGTMTYTINGANGSKSITRDVFATGATSPAQSMTGLWNNANEPGWGAAVIQQYGVMFVTMYVYDGSGNPIWYVASNCPVTNNGCTGPLYKVTGGSLPTAGWTGQITVATAGTLTLAFSDANAGAMTYTINGANGSKAITRNVFQNPPAGSSDPGTPTTLVTSANGQSTVSCAENQQCIDPLFAKAINLASTLSQVASSWTNTGSNIVTISQIPYVDGAVSAKDIAAAGSVFSTSTDASYRYFKGNGLPSTTMGKFPVQSGTAAYPYYSALPGGTDPRTGSDYSSAAAISISPYDITSRIPLNPAPTGFYPINSLIVGITLTGTVWHSEIANDSSNNWYNPINALPLDQCWGHPYAQQYHIHGYSWKCFPNQGTSGHSPLFGYALDGFGIYGPRGEDGQMITNKQLDKCHGHTHVITWNGTQTSMYHYHLNREYPYSVGCFRGQVNYFQALGSTEMRETNLPFYQDIPYPPSVTLPPAPPAPPGP